MTAGDDKKTSATDFEFAVLGEARNYRRRLIREFGDHLRGHVLEVGAGIGQTTAELRKNPAITRLASIELDARFCDQLRATCPGQTVICGTIADLNDDGKWNAIISINVLEHIEDDEHELAFYSKVLAPQNGVLCLFVPARPEIYAPIDKHFGHYRRYTRPQLRRKLENAGFEILQLTYYNFIGYFGWWLNFCLMKRCNFDLGSVLLFDRVIFPIAHAYESKVHPPPIGQSLIAMARASRL
jgi:SAM-dependent methyltransferase